MRARKQRKGQSEVIGGLIVLTLLFMFAIPIILNSYYASIQAAQEAKTSLSETRLSLNEKLAVSPVDPTNELAQRAGWIPGVWINNTGTVAVTLDKLYLVDQANNTIYAVYDLRWARPGIAPQLEDFIIDPVSPDAYTPPAGDYVTLQPGQSLLIVFNESILPAAPNLYVLVESISGILHPIAGGGAPQTLYPGRPSEVNVEGLWRGVFAPQSGFLMIGADEIKRYSNIWGERPCYRYSWEGWSRGGWAYDNDPDVPPFYRLEFYKYWRHQLLRGFLGTFDNDPENSIRVRVDGLYADTWGADSPCIKKYTSNSRLSRFMTTGDMDRNGVDEVIFYTYWIHYYGGSDRNPDSDFDGNSWSDSISLNIQSARDISGVDFIKVSAKIIYDIAIYGDGEPHIPLKVFSLALWVYDPDTGSWKLYTTKDYDFVNNGPRTFVISATFPTHRNETYRVGVIFYDPYKRIYDGAYYEFMMGLEHMIVEYGVLNPLFKESPPLYLVAIPDPNLIGEIGEKDYAEAYNVSDLNEAKIRAQTDLLEKIKKELDYAGVSGYTVIRDRGTLCNLLFGDNPPKYAIIIWLQGNVSVAKITDRYCGIGDSELAGYMVKFHWVLVWPFGEPFGERSRSWNYDPALYITDPGQYDANITEWGMKIWKDAYAYYLFNTVKFKYLVRQPSHIILNATFYNASSGFYGTIAFWLETDGRPRTIEEGVVVLNPVHIDWDLTGDGAMPETVVQQVVYSSLVAWAIMTYGG